MISALIRKEALECIHDLKFPYAIVLSTALVVLTCCLCADRYMMELDEYNRAAELNRRTIQAQAHWWRYHFGFTIMRRPSFSRTLVGGSEATSHIRAKVGVGMEDRGLPQFQGGVASGSVLSTLLGTIDLSFLMKYLMSLLAIFFGHDVITREKESGTLRMILCHELGRTRFLIGKWLGSWIVVVGLALVPSALGLLLVRAGWNIPLTTESTLELTLGFVVFALYLTIVYSAAVLVSTIASCSASALSASLLLWIGAVFIVPKTSAVIAELVSPVPSGFAFQNELRETRERQSLQFDQEFFDQYLADHPFTYEAMRAYSERILGLAVRTEEALRERYSAQKQRQIRLTGAMASVSPMASTTFAVASSVGADSQSRDDFVRDVFRHKSEFLNYFARIQVSVYDKKENLSDAYLRLGPAPEFHEVRIALGERIRRSVPWIAILLVWGTVLPVASLLSFQRCDVR